MDAILINDAARAVHLFGLAIGLGLALFAETLALRSVFEPMEQANRRLIAQLHRGVFLGLALLWVSGITLLYLRTGFHLDQMSAKLLAKLAVVSILTVNATAIGLWALPRLDLLEHRAFLELPMVRRLGFAGIAAVSASAWISALGLGVFSQLKPMGAWELFTLFSGVFGAVLGVALIVACIGPLVWRGVIRARRLVQV